MVYLYHSLTFINLLDPTDTINTYSDWHLMPTSRPLIAPPSVQTKSVQVTGANGTIDLTDILTGYPTYSNRSGTFEFAVLNDYWPWEVAYSTIMRRLHGKRWKLVLEDDPGHYYIGRFAVNQWSSSRDWSRITIGYDVGPFKKDISSSVDPWLWDTFNFETGVIRDYASMACNGSLTITLTGEEEPVTPTITVSTAMTLQHTYGGTTNTYSLAAGANKPRGLVIFEGDNTLLFTGTGTVSIDYRGGSL